MLRVKRRLDPDATWIYIIIKLFGCTTSPELMHNLPLVYQKSVRSSNCTSLICSLSLSDIFTFPILSAKSAAFSMLMKW
jgi:hypothetical protein